MPSAAQPTGGPAPARTGDSTASQIVEFVAEQVTRWYRDNARDLPWRRHGTTAWGVLVSEVMAQQTPVARVAPQWIAWMTRWSTPDALAAATPAEVLKQWDRLGYPRRALRLQECAKTICERHNGAVPTTYELLLALPGVGDYTAAAVLAFAFGQRALVMDTNIRRVHARVFAGVANHAAHITAGERAALDAAMPRGPGAAEWTQAVMELGAVICRPQPSCTECPLVSACEWNKSGMPATQTPARRPQKFAGTDRQVRGKVMALLREADGEPVAISAIEKAWHDQEQLQRALASLVADGLAEVAGKTWLRLPRD